MTDWNRTMEQAVRDTIRARVLGAWVKGFLVGVVVGAVLAGRRNNDHNDHNYEKRICAECGMVSNPGAIGRHQKYSGHKEVMPYAQ